MKIALIGNPNSGKTTIFNQLTGLRQKTGNYPGITVDRKSGKLAQNSNTEIIDLPGLYDLYPDSEDEAIVLKELLKSGSEYEGIVYITEAANLDRSLLLFSQLADMGLPMLVVLNMMDEAKRDGYQIDIKKLSNRLGVKVLSTTARNGDGIENLITHISNSDFSTPNAFFRSRYQKIDSVEIGYFSWLKSAFNNYLSDDITDYVKVLEQVDNKLILEDVDSRIKMTRQIAHETVQKTATEKERGFTDSLDRWATHPILGYLIFLGILLVMFQALFAWSSVPMDFIDGTFSSLSNWVSTNMGDSLPARVLAEGLIPGIGGVVIFIPQIAFLFFFLGLLEESGYMSRVVFLMDRIMQSFGLNGKSIVPLMSGLACSIPAIIATRTIENTKERLITLLVTPFMTCSARLPVYAILIAVVIPSVTWFGLNVQGLVLLGLYLLGTMAALVSAAIISRFMKTENNSYLIMEMPVYRLPSWKNLFINIYNKVKTFVVEAGKIILLISLVLWVLASYGPNNLDQKTADHRTQLSNTELSEKEIDNQVNAYKLENSYAGKMGKFIEPVVAPLGYDWKISIALITSFAAREVFVGTLATIYSVGEDFEDETIIQKLSNETIPGTNRKRFTLATALSLLIFYAFAMQCMSTLAIVYRETKSWKWPLYQLVGMTALAYGAAWVTYVFLS